MTMAKIQPFFKVNSISIGYFDGIRVFPRMVTGKNKASFSYNNLFCLLWKSESVSFNQAIKDVKKNF